MSENNDAVTPLDILRRDGWCQYIWRDDEGRHCLMGAFIAAYNDDDLTEEWPGYQEVRDVIREQFPDRVRVHGAIEIQFNNHKDTTFADVELVLEKAQLRYDERI